MSVELLSLTEPSVSDQLQIVQTPLGLSRIPSLRSGERLSGDPREGPAPSLFVVGEVINQLVEPEKIGQPMVDEGPVEHRNRVAPTALSMTSARIPVVVDALLVTGATEVPGKTPVREAHTAPSGSAGTYSRPVVVAPWSSFERSSRFSRRLSNFHPLR